LTKPSRSGYKRLIQVTETDKCVEKLILLHLNEKFPAHNFVGEETAAETGNMTGHLEGLTWIIGTSI
jgi:fructose-1,6-bisphosphatase/inositol monophosphatase family enzyme